MIDPTDNNASAIIEVSRDLGRSETARPEQKKIGNLDVLITRDAEVKSLERFADNPRRKRARVSLYEAASFIDYVNRHKLPGRTTLFGKATELGGSFGAVIDYHAEEPKAAAVTTTATASSSSAAPADAAAPVLVSVAIGDAAPAWGEHNAELTLQTTPEWQRWIGHNGKLLAQETFAEFIEDNLSDIVRPDAASILEMAQGLQGKKNVSFKSGKNLRDGSIQLEYVEAIEVQGAATRRDDNFKLPDKFTLGIVPFVGANGVEIEARLRFRIGNDGKLSFAYILNRPFKLIEEAFNATRGDIETGTGIKVLLGSGSITNPTS